MPLPTDQQIAEAASQASIPPAILLGVVRHQSADGNLQVPAGVASGYGLDPKRTAQDPSSALTVLARVLSQQFHQYGDWEQAVSAYLTGDPMASESPTSPVGGLVHAILGSASVNAQFGLNDFTPQNLTMFQSGSTSFVEYMGQLMQAGGVINQQSVSGFQSAVQGIGTVPYRSNANTQQMLADVLRAAQIPLTQANVALLQTMARGEGMDPGTFNPLATTQGPGQNFNSVGVKVFADYQTGVEWTARTLLNGNYNRMVELMRSGADLHTLAADPGVQANLRTWQGGSSEDVNLMLRSQNVPASPLDAPAAGQSGAPAPRVDHLTAPDPEKVAGFAEQLQARNIDPGIFAAHFPFIAAQRRRLLQENATSVSDYADLTERAGGSDHALVLEYLMNQPHPVYPELKVGQMAAQTQRVRLLSRLHSDEEPHHAEVAAIASSDLKWDELNAYYKNRAGVQDQQLQHPEHRDDRSEEITQRAQDRYR